MSILFNKTTNVIIQGITGNEGRYHTKLMLDYGTKIVAGITPNKAGQEVFGIPVFDTIKDAIATLRIQPETIATGVFVPANACFYAVKEAIEIGIKKIILITEGIPISDVLRIVSLAKKTMRYLSDPTRQELLQQKNVKLVCYQHIT